MAQKGGIALILLILIIAAGLAVGVYLVVQKTNLFPQASDQSPASQINSDEPNISLKSQYQNPFDEKTSYQNPFDSYQNPFDSL